MRTVDTGRLRLLILQEFADIVADVTLPQPHWERRAIDGTVYRCDNAPHKRWEEVKTFPHHFHNGSEEDVTDSFVDSDPEAGITRFMRFVRQRLQSSVI